MEKETDEIDEEAINDRQVRWLAAAMAAMKTSTTGAAMKSAPRRPREKVLCCSLCEHPLDLSKKVGLSHSANLLQTMG